MQHQFGLCSFKFDYICGPKRKCFLSLSPDKNAGKSVAWSTDSPFVRLGKINAENEIHPLIMNRRTDASSVPPTSRRDGGGRSQKMERDERRERSNAQNGRPRRRRRGHRKAGKKNRSLNKAPSAKFTQHSKLENLSELHIAFS